ncbi:hypothetical protein DICSQDRAFT_175427 [Dichomitus squalens LYAD-421 SS1]|uniref:Uncharacterized protein n=1 Tax=Dichomitus squalens (strain LYAD-421) TaxID=732165 RepID=R7SLE7_DICSQ|nr:uncharacterized protein DICSQDRAFT_175427 [Dichomitus squalens LYAD-421 SS1]EJF55862.1 hypothetical protein DICSQDRAFT_175427 [Dichomitus squalens LYAD-421 SS1]
MTEEEREQEKVEIFEKFGPSIAEVLRRAREARESKQKKSEGEKVGTEPSSSNTPASAKTGGEEAGTSLSPPSSPSRPRSERTRSLTSVLRSSSPSPTSSSSTRPPSRSGRKIRFADVTLSDIHVYESAPPSPRKKALALPPPSASDDQVVSLGTWKPPAQFRSPVVPLAASLEAESEASQEVAGKVGALEEGTPEDIRRRFFPTAPANDPSLEWMRGTGTAEREPETESSTPTIRFDLTGTPIPAHLSNSLPTHLGLHHHAEGSHAGYTLEDIFLLSRSTVPAQRASMLGVLAKIAHKLARTSVDKKKGIPELVGQEIALRKRLLAAGAEAIGERASVGARAVELLWECTSQWDEDLKSVDGVETKDLDRGEALSSLPLDYLLPQIANALSVAELPHESLLQLLAVLHRLAQHSNSIATEIVKTKNLIPSIFQRFLLTPIPPTDDSPFPNPLALKFLCLLAASSRENASALVDPADSLLRFVITLPTSSPYPLPLATQLLSETLIFYATLASYGFYAHVTTTAQEYFLQISKYIRSADCQSSQLRGAWLRALEAWTVCARDPHRTTPSHEVLWSQVVGWGWAEDMLELRTQLNTSDEETWARLWSALAAFLEGAKVNGVRGGEEERALVLGALKDDFAFGTQKQVVELALKWAREALGKLSAGMRQGILASDVPSLRDVDRHAGTLASAMRLFLSCFSESPGDTLIAPPFNLPFGDLSSVCAVITTHPLWTSLYTSQSIPYGHLLCRPLSTLLASYLQLSRKIPGTSPDFWMAQGFAILCRLFPGDEAVGERTVVDIAETITADFLRARGWSVPEDIWEKGGMDVIVPFLTQSLRAKGEQVIGPTWSTPQSIATATTQRLPPLSSLQPNDQRDYPLPLTKDWMFCPLDHLLKSGESEVFKNLPDSWNASEAEVVRATLLFVRVSQEVLRYHRLNDFLMSREEVAFGCMKVFMLEHGQQQDDSSEEVFRDTIVGRLMTELLAPFSASASAKTLKTPPPSIHTSDSIDVVAKRFLGNAVPFYQWYTDFVGLYDAISFAHPLFARLLLPPLSMRYPADYRKYLWADFNHVLRTIRTAPEDVVTGSIAEYLWPVETDAEVVGAYLRALVKGSLEGFVRLVAVHHIACNIWPDLGSVGEERTKKLLKAVLVQGGLEAIRDVVLYRQNREGTVVLPPACFEQPGKWRAQRLDFAGKSGEDVRERLTNLLEGKAN